MEFHNSILFKELQLLQRDGVNGTAYSYTAFVHVKDTNMVYRMPKVISIDVNRDYLGCFADKMIIRVAVTGGIYTKKIYPYYKNLELTLVREPRFNITNERDHGRHSLAERYTAHLVDTSEPTTKDGVEDVSQEVLDLANLLEIEFELVNKTAEELNMITCGGTFRNLTTDVVVKSVLTNEACQGGNDANSTVKGVDMVEASNLEPREHIIIPHGTKLVDLPNYIQNKCGGIYNSGLGYYLQERYWYLYPAFDYSRINDTERTITFIHLPKNKIPLIEQTFRYKGNQIIAVCTGSISISDHSDFNQRNEGNGVSFTTARSVLHGMVASGGNKAVIDRTGSNTEASTSDRPDGKNYTPVSNNAPITDNAMVEFSKMAREQAGVVTLVWENSEPTAILPGMLCRIYYLESEQVKSVVGVIGGAQHYTYLYGKGFTADAYLNSTALTVFIDPKTLK